MLVIRLTQAGGGSYTGSVSLAGTHGETTAGAAAISAGTLANGLKYAAWSPPPERRFAGQRLLHRLRRGADRRVRRHQLRPDPATAFKDAAVDPLAIARQKAAKAAGVAGGTCC